MHFIKGKMHAKVNQAKKKNQNTVFIVKNLFTFDLYLFHFSDAKSEIINFMVQFSDTLVYRSQLRYGFYKQNWIVILL